MILSLYNFSAMMSSHLISASPELIRIIYQNILCVIEVYFAVLIDVRGELCKIGVLLIVNDIFRFDADDEVAVNG
jgi:hypothetical protein